MDEKRRGLILGEPQVSCTELKDEHDFVVLACDGLWDVVDSVRCIEQAKIFLRGHWDPTACAQHLAQEAVLTRGATDNVSVIIATLRSAPFKVRRRKRVREGERE